MAPPRAAEEKWRTRPLAGGHAFGGGAWSPDGAYAALVQEDGRLRLLSGATGVDVPGFHCAARALRIMGVPGNVRWSPTGRRLLIEAADGLLESATIVDVPSGNSRRVATTGANETRPLAAWSPDGESVAAATDQLLVVVDAATGAERLRDEVPATGAERRTALWFAPDGRLVDARLDKIVVSNGVDVREFPLAVHGTARPSPDGSRFAIGYTNVSSPRTGIFDLDGVLRFHASGSDVAFSAGGEFVVISSSRISAVYATATGVPVARLKFIFGYYDKLSRDGRSVLRKSGDAYIVHDVASGVAVVKTTTAPMAFGMPGYRPGISVFGPTESTFLVLSTDARYWDTTPRADRLVALFGSAAGAALPIEVMRGVGAFLP